MRKNCSSDREKLLKFETEGREFAIFLRPKDNLDLEDVIFYIKLDKARRFNSIISVLTMLKYVPAAL